MSTSFLGLSALSPFGFGESLADINAHQKTFDPHIRDDEAIGVLELRNYLLKPGMRDKFNRYFTEHFVTSQEALDGYLLGQFFIDGENDRFFWMRGFGDMKTRSKFLPAFYGGSPAWRTFGPGANDMMLEVHNVHLVRPLVPAKRSTFLNSSRRVVIDYYTTHDNRLEELITVFRSAYLPALTSGGLQPSLWISEMTENDFPRLPVIQDQNLLVVITGSGDEDAYKRAAGIGISVGKDLKEKLQDVVKNRRTLVLRRSP